MLGSDDYQCDLVYKTFTNVIDVACGHYHSVALLENGTIKCWGNNTLNQCDSVYKTFTNIINIACGSYHSVALKNDGTIECWDIIDGINVI